MGTRVSKTPHPLTKLHSRTLLSPATSTRERSTHVNRLRPPIRLDDVHTRAGPPGRGARVRRARAGAWARLGAEGVRAEGARRRVQSARAACRRVRASGHAGVAGAPARAAGLRAARGRTRDPRGGGRDSRELVQPYESSARGVEPSAFVSTGRLEVRHGYAARAARTP